MSILTGVKCAALAVLTILGMSLAARLCSMAESWIVGSEQFVGVSIYALTDIGVGVGDERRRCAAWFFVATSVAVVRAVRPIGSAVGKILYFGFIDFVMPRDACTRHRSSPSLTIGCLYYMVACSDVCVYFGLRQFDMVARLFYFATLLLGCHFVGTAIAADSLSTSDYILCSGTCACSIMIVFVRVGSLQVDAIIRSVLFMVLQRSLIKLRIPCAKGCFGEQWRVAVFVVVYAMELPVTLLLVDAPPCSIKFWLRVVLQEGNALLEHLGLYHTLYCRVVAFIGRPVGDDAAQVSDERRAWWLRVIASPKHSHRLPFRFMFSLVRL